MADTEGTWQAGRHGAPGAMIMPASPEKGDVYRSENLPGVVFEEVTVKAVGETVDGPYGKVEGAMTVTELHMDGSTEEKVFAPGYGEFSTGDAGGDLEAVSLAVPTDAKSGAVPGELAALERVARAAQNGEATAGEVRAAWSSYLAADDVPALLERQMTRDVEALAGLEGEDSVDAALRVAQDVTDLRLPYDGVREADRERFALWARQSGIDAAAGEAGAVAGDVTSLELVWERLDGGTNEDLQKARETADRKDMAEAGRLATVLERSVGSG